MTILVTGGSGFVGSTLTQRLVKEGKKVRVFDVIDFEGRPEEAEFMKGDIRSEADIQRALEGVDTVYHNVALVPLTKAGKEFWEVNVIGTVKLLKWCRKQRIKRFIHTSSSTVFGVAEFSPIDANTPLQTIEEYGASKLAQEDLVKQYMSEGNIATILRPRTILGSYRLGIFQILFEWISEDRNVYVIGKGNNLFQFVHVDDLVDAMVKSCEMGQSGIFNIGTDRFNTLREDLEAFIKAIGSKSKVKSLPEKLSVTSLKILDKLKLSPLAPWHYMTYHKPFHFDVKREKSVLGWQPQYSNLEMMQASYNWYLENKEKLKHQKSKESTHHSAPKQKILKLLKWLS